MLWWFELCSPDSFKFRLSICCCAKVWWRCPTPHYSRLSCGWETPLKELPKALSLFCVSSEIRATHFYGWTFITLSICTWESLLSFQHMNNALGSYIKHAGGMRVKANRCSCAPVLWDPVLVQCQSQMGRKPCQLASVKRFCFSMAVSGRDPPHHIVMEKRASSYHKEMQYYIWEALLSWCRQKLLCFDAKWQIA